MYVCMYVCMNVYTMYVQRSKKRFLSYLPECQRNQLALLSIQVWMYVHVFL